eukprot:gene7876-1086_t
MLDDLLNRKSQHRLSGDQPEDGSEAQEDISRYRINFNLSINVQELATLAHLFYESKLPLSGKTRRSLVAGLMASTEIHGAVKWQA